MLARVFGLAHRSAPRFQMNMRPSSTGWSVSTPIRAQQVDPVGAPARRTRPAAARLVRRRPWRIRRSISRIASTRSLFIIIALSSQVRPANRYARASG
jgi:hypothetical protein